MIRSCELILCCFLLGLTLNASAQQSTTAASAPPPLVGTLAGHPDWPAAKNPGDVDTVDHLIASLYDVISGTAGQRDWDRFRALFLPEGRLAVVVPESAATKDAQARKGDADFLTPDMFAQRDDPYFKTHGFFERSIANRVEEFGNLVEVWSTYESRNAKDDAQPFSRGINSVQIVHAHGRFWIASLLFDDERPGLTLPTKYLKTAGNGESAYQSPATATVNCTEASLPDTPSWRISAKVSGSYDGEESFKEGGVEYRDAGKTECFEGECSLTTEDSDPTFWGELKLH
jgi:hypothetical protein